MACTLVSYYWEVEILASSGEDAHVRVGWSARSGELQGPVGYDKHSYGYRDVNGADINNAYPMMICNTHKTHASGMAVFATYIVRRLLSNLVFISLLYPILLYYFVAQIVIHSFINVRRQSTL